MAFTVRRPFNRETNRETNYVSKYKHNNTPHSSRSNEYEKPYFKRDMPNPIRKRNHEEADKFLLNSLEKIDKNLADCNRGYKHNNDEVSLKTASNNQIIGEIERLSSILIDNTKKIGALFQSDGALPEILCLHKKNNDLSEQIWIYDKQITHNEEEISAKAANNKELLNRRIVLSTKRQELSNSLLKQYDSSQQHQTPRRQYTPPVIKRLTSNNTKTVTDYHNPAESVLCVNLRKSNKYDAENDVENDAEDEDVGNDTLCFA